MRLFRSLRSLPSPGSLVEALRAGGLRRFGADAVEACHLLRDVEEARWREGPSALVGRLRETGLGATARSQAERKRLSKLVFRLDHLLFAEPNCYRRSLVELALDPTAAREPVLLGLDLQRPGDLGPRGHAWVRGRDGGKTWDVEFQV